tara:strand:+ start:114 stop:1157 length:1044 start_codon:yes stop_codon:yes gene_type:complete
MAFGLETYVVNPYLRALIVLAVAFVVLKFVVLGLQKIAVRLTSKTKTDMDDKFIAKSSKPGTFLVLVIGFKIAINELPLNPGVLSTVSSILSSLMIVALAYIGYYFVDIILFVGIRKMMKNEDSSARDSLLKLAEGILRVIFIAMTLLYILSAWGIEIGPLLATLGVAGLAVALALQPALANIFSGVSIILDKSVKVGDLIYLDADTKGKVASIGLRSTRILSFDNEYIIVPNSKIADSKIQNIGEPEPKTRVVVPFGVAYGSDVEKVKKLVKGEIVKIKHFVSEPEPVVRFLEMGDSSLNFKAYFYVESFEYRIGAIDEANTKIYNVLNKAGIGIPFPQMDVHMKK